MSIKLGQVSAVIISSAEGAKEALKTQDVQFADRPLVLAAKIVRKEELSDFVRFLHCRAGTPVNLTKTLFALTNSIMAITSIGEKCRNQEALLSIIDEIIEIGGGFSVLDVFPSLKILHVITGMKFRLERLHQLTDRILKGVITEHKAAKAVTKINDGDDDDDQSKAHNLLDVLLDLQEHGNLQVPLTKRQHQSSYSAGSDTSSSTKEWAISELMRNPKAMKKAQQEVRFGEAGKVDEARLHDLKFLKLVIKETLRLHPSGALIPRECRERTKIDGYDIYPKIKALVNVWAIGGDPNIWIEAEKFCPERFLNSWID
ncbi:cytochrome P450, putative [Ricinus communis]|uniref:Cytochrome P450, putative n=1 Tax=Ricinus communis TaxID=3988 RepID=B9S3I3_RICCO|nr:cytochrome P450, putative [Ricinus communis]